MFGIFHENMFCCLPFSQISVMAWEDQKLVSSLSERGSFWLDSGDGSENWILAGYDVPEKHGSSAKIQEILTS